MDSIISYKRRHLDSIFFYNTKWMGRDGVGLTRIRNKTSFIG